MTELTGPFKTLGITAVFGMAAAGSPSFAAIGVFAALWSFGVGGNLPVDSAIYLEFLPASHQYLLTVLSVAWAIAQVVATLIAWPLLGNLTCEDGDETCAREDNMGWRWFLICVGGLTVLMFIIRFGSFTIFESPKFLMGKGRDEDAVRIVHEVARRNGKEVSLTVEDLRAVEPEGYVPPAKAGDAIRRKLEDVKLDRIKALFATRKLALSTSLVMGVWALIGLGYVSTSLFFPFQSLHSIIDTLSTTRSFPTSRRNEGLNLETAQHILLTGTA